jgi:trk system potassium uptake protein TrkH
MPKVIGSLVQHPARVSFLCYAAAILAGGVVLTLPFCRAAGTPPITLLDGVFTATSASCVTGLTVRSTGQDFSFLGQLIVLVLIQLGGIGIMTVTTFITCQVGGRQRLRARAVISETLGMGDGKDLREVLWSVVRYTLVIESAGVLLLATRFQFD